MFGYSKGNKNGAMIENQMKKLSYLVLSRHSLHGVGNFQDPRDKELARPRVF